jgi:hypothetical protein
MANKDLLIQPFLIENRMILVVREVIEMTLLMLANNFNHEQVLQAHTILMNAHQQGLAVESIMNKAHEGWLNMYKIGMS